MYYVFPLDKILNIKNCIIFVNRETVRKIMKLIDPEGVSARSRNKLKRRMYLNKVIKDLKPLCNNSAVVFCIRKL